MPQPPKRLDPWPNATGWQRMAEQPSRLAPTVAEVLAAQVGVPPILKPDLPGLLNQFSARDLEFEDGQLVGLSLTGRSWLTCGEALRRLAPIRKLRLIAVGPCVNDFANQNAFHSLEQLDLSGCRLGEELLKVLAVGALRRTGDVSRLGSSQSTPATHVDGSLKTLNLSANNLTDAILQQLAEASWPCLEQLDLSQNKLTSASLHWFTQADYFPKLKTLRLANGLQLPPECVESWQREFAGTVLLR